MPGRSNLTMQSLSQRGDAKQTGEHDGLKIGSIVRVWWFHRRLVFIITALAALATTLTVTLQEKLFTSVALIKIDHVPNHIIRAGRRVSKDQRGNPVIANCIVFMSSRSFLGMLADREQLYTDPELTQIPTGSRSEASEGPTRDEELVMKSTVIDALAERLIVTQRGGSHVISVEATSADPAKAARIANAAVEIFMSKELVRLRELEQKSLDWLKKKVRMERGELASLEGNALKILLKHGLRESREDPYISQGESIQWTELTTQLADIKAERADIQARHQSALSWTNNHGVDASLAIAKSPLLDELRNTETILVRRLSELEQDLGERHPTMISLRNDLQSTRQRMLIEAEGVLHHLKGEMLISSAREAEIEAQITTLQKRITAKQKARSELHELDREIRLRQMNLNNLIEHKMNIEEKQLSRQIGSNVLSLASIPTIHDSPNIWPLIAYTSLGTMLFSLVGVFFRDRWVSDFGFRNPEDLRVLNLRPIGMVPELIGKTSNGVAVEDCVVMQPHSVEAEAIQRVRNHLYRLRPKLSGDATVVSIVSSSPLEGKTTMAVALARQAAIAGSKVLLVDADIRHPSVPTRLGLEAKAGLCQLLLGERQDEPRIEKDPSTSLHLLQAGSSASNPADLFRSKQMARLVDELRQHYDWIFFDSPSISAVVDGIILAKHADLVVYVARWLETTRNVVQMDIERLRDAGVTCEGVALTRVDMASYEKYEHLDELRYYGYSSLGA